ncbi:MAG: primary-amine oxidase [Planctomycetia bacterium]|nr:primary-amine oxidase [Planctomycetia bacterium]
MNHEPDRDRSLDGILSRRTFFRGSLLAAGALALTELNEDSTHAADEAIKPTNTKPSNPHPLDPLSPTEIGRAVEIVRASYPTPKDLRFVTVTLREPSKQIVREHGPKKAIPREAFLILLDTSIGKAMEAIVDLRQEKLVSFDKLPHAVQPPIMADEFAECEEAVKRSPEFLAALKKRGIDDVKLVMVDPWSAGIYGTELPEDAGKRLSRALCWVRSEVNDNGYARPLDGVIAVVDLNKMEVLRIEDYGVVPLPPESGNWAREYLRDVRQDLKPLEITQPQGPSFTVDGYEVAWQKWKFRIGFTPREGLVLHTLSYADGDRERAILARASVCEMVVPYGDPAERHFRKNAFDIGEYGIGTMANSLQLGCDCLGSMRYFDAHMTDSRGQPLTIKNAICLHEEDSGLLWKHTDWRTGSSETRRSRRLSASFIATVGNYEYGFFWYLYQDGSLQCEVKLTGIMNTTALKPGEQPEYGVEIAPQLNAPFHQHVFAARLDMSIDGAENSVYEVNAVRIPRGSDNPHGNAFRAEETLLKTEQQAKRMVNGAAGRFWRIVNPGKKNRLGRSVGYRLVTGENCPILVQPDAAVMKRAGFLASNLWVTPYRTEERYPSGEYPNQNPGGDGLPKWTANDRQIENTDLVVWYVFGHNHVPRPEDWPVMPVSTIGFMLKPDGFFERNPAMDVPSPTK